MPALRIPPTPSVVEDTEVAADRAAAVAADFMAGEEAATTVEAGVSTVAAVAFVEAEALAAGVPSAGADAHLAEAVSAAAAGRAAALAVLAAAAFAERRHAALRG